MARIKVALPQSFLFFTIIPVRISDINYGNHVGNDAILSIIHEARMQFLHHFGYTEMEFAGVGMIMSDVAIEFKQEILYGEKIFVSIAIEEFSKISFELCYKLEKEIKGKKIIAAIAKTGMVCYDYKNKKVAFVPEEVKLRLKPGV